MNKKFKPLVLAFSIVFVGLLITPLALAVTGEDVGDYFASQAASIEAGQGGVTSATIDNPYASSSDPYSYTPGTADYMSSVFDSVIGALGGSVDPVTGYVSGDWGVSVSLMGDSLFVSFYELGDPVGGSGTTATTTYNDYDSYDSYVACYSDANCNDNNPSTLDKCVNPGSYSSYCTHTPVCTSTSAVVQSVSPTSPVVLNANEQFTITATVVDNCGNPDTTGSVYYKITSSTANCQTETYTEQLSHTGNGVWQKTATTPSSSGTYKVCVKAL